MKDMFWIIPSSGLDFLTISYQTITHAFVQSHNSVLRESIILTWLNKDTLTIFLPIFPQ